MSAKRKTRKPVSRVRGEPVPLRRLDLLAARWRRLAKFTHDMCKALLLTELAGDLETAVWRIRKKQVRKKDFTCFKCGDGSTPLYCLNCATEKEK